jgi:hypothetical protein
LLPDDPVFRVDLLSHDPILCVFEATPPPLASAAVFMPYRALCIGRRTGKMRLITAGVMALIANMIREGELAS